MSGRAVLWRKRHKHFAVMPTRSKEWSVRGLNLGLYCGFVPIKTTGASSNAPPNAIVRFCNGGISTVKGIPADLNAERTISVSGDDESGIRTPKATAPDRDIDNIWICQCAFSKTFTIWIARYWDSVSLAVHCTLILPVRVASAFSSLVAISGDIVRQAKRAFSNSCS